MYLALSRAQKKYARLRKKEPFSVRVFEFKTNDTTQRKQSPTHQQYLTIRYFKHSTIGAQPALNRCLMGLLRIAKDGRAEKVQGNGARKEDGEARRAVHLRQRQALVQVPVLKRETNAHSAHESKRE
jgi:hypothetical protein